MGVIRKYVGVLAEFTSDGQMLPREVIWDDGRIFGIEKIVSAKKSAELRTGGLGLRFDCLISGKQKRIFFDERKWFVECGV
jgi:hypothetical protein